MKLLVSVFLLQLFVDVGDAECSVCPKWCVSLPNPCQNVVCEPGQICVKRDGKPICFNTPCLAKKCGHGNICVPAVGCKKKPCHRCVNNPCESYTCLKGQTCQVLPIYCQPAPCTFGARPVCVDNNPCKQPKVRGPCYALITRWYFNRVFNICHTFIYGGCGGNDNNFETKEACQKRCPGTPPRTCKNFPCPKGEKCRLVDTGIRCVTTPCPSFKPVCSSINICHLPKKPGPCYGNFPRWFYNKNSYKCEKFIYGGCQGNANRFTTEIECERFCGKKHYYHNAPIY